MDERKSNREELQRITLAYVQGRERGESPTLEELVRDYPQYTNELVDFATNYYITEEIGCDEAALTAIEGDDLTLERRVLDQAFTQVRYPPTLTSLIARARQRGYDVLGLSTELNLGVDVVAKIEQRLLIEVPFRLLEALGRVLAVSLQQIEEYLTQTTGIAAPAATFFYSAQPPKLGRKQTFSDAVRTSRVMTPAQKAKWLDIADESRTSIVPSSPTRRVPRRKRGR